MDDHAAQAYSFAQETVKQVVALSTGIIAVTVALLGSLKSAAPHGTLWILHVAWVSGAVSAICGVLVLMMLTGDMGQRTLPGARAIYRQPIAMLYLVEFAAFIVAVGFTTAFGFAVA
jgi:hypothetical protein